MVNKQYLEVMMINNQIMQQPKCQQPIGKFMKDQKRKESLNKPSNNNKIKY